jgi:hypothetical protein
MKANMADVRIISFTTADPNHQVEFSVETKAETQAAPLSATKFAL